jgi:NADH-quinone oxidoreductase subunit L
MLLYALPLVLPLLGFLILFFSGPFYKLNNSKTQAILCRLSVIFMFVNLIFCSIFFIFDRTSNIITELTFSFFFKSHVSSISSELILLNSFVNPNTTYFFDYSLLYDSLTIIMLFVVIGVSALVQLFSTEYMSHDLYISRFFSFLNFFSLCMLVLVTAGNFIQMFVGWEGVGVASFLLIGFWFSRTQAVKCALKAVIVNRVGDCALLLAFSIIAFSVGDMSYLSFFSLLESGSDFNLLMVSNILPESMLDSALINSLLNSFIFYKIIWVFGSGLNTLFIIGLLIIIGAFAKSAQFGLHTWLPDAMEGPTPVSALIHAATMVTAGVFLIIRCAPLFLLNDLLSDILLIFGSITALFGASVAASQYDIKKIIAYSTCSQLGYMIAACGISRFDLAIFHLTTHAFFKAGLFLCAGLIIHALGDEQDIRKMSGLTRLLPITYMSVFICSFCLGGLPFFSGFYSKDAIIESAYQFDALGWFSFNILLLAAFLTALYSIRFFYYVFWRDYYAGIRAKTFLISETLASSFSVMILSFVSIFLGFYFVFGNFRQYFELNSLSINTSEALCNSLYGFFWINPKISLGFTDYYFDEDSLHQVLPFAIFFILVSVMLVSFYLTFFFKPILNVNRFQNFLLNNSSFRVINISSRHVYNFFAKAWLFDIFVSKLSRLIFFMSRNFIQRNIEAGLFEFISVVFSVRTLSFFQGYIQNFTTTGNLSTYIYNIVFGGLFFAIMNLLIFITVLI